MMLRGAMVMVAGVLASTSNISCQSEVSETERWETNSSAARGDKGGSPHVEGAGNNLSFPVIFSDGITLALRGSFGFPKFDGASAVAEDGTLVYLQQDPNNEWQAETAVPTGVFNVDFIDWGDNLEARPWTENSKVRVETVLYQKLVPTMSGFGMHYVEGQGTSEVWGTDREEYDSDEATVYSGCARLTIQKIDDSELHWDTASAQWEDGSHDPAPVFFKGGVWEGGDGPGSYSAEVNVSGKLIYGYNWDVKRTGDGAGVYRITFSLSGDCGVDVLNTFFDAETTILEPEPEEETTTAEAEAGEPAGGVAAVDYENNLTYIDVTITARGGGGGKGMQGGH